MSKSPRILGSRVSEFHLLRPTQLAERDLQGFSLSLIGLPDYKGSERGAEVCFSPYGDDETQPIAKARSLLCRLGSKPFITPSTPGSFPLQERRRGERLLCEVSNN
jgi:hypothetical protein